jgi:hypothetical protein
MALVGAREERLAQNEALFREVNERVVEVATHFIEVETKSEAVEFTDAQEIARETDPRT